MTTEMKDGALSVFDTALASLYLGITARTLAAASSSGPVALSATQGDHVVIDVSAADGDGAALLASLQALGLEHGSSFKGVVSGSIAVADLGSLLGVQDLGSARESTALLNVGTVTTQADAAQHNDVARTTYGVDGTGIKVGVMSDSFNTSTNADKMANDIASGDLPTDTTILQDYAGGTDEGRGMAQLIHDLAPGASIEFATAFNGQAGFANNIVALANAGAKIIVDDVSYATDYAFQDGIIAQAVDQVTAAGVTYFSSAGNYGHTGYEAPFNAGTVPITFSYAGYNYTADQFSPGVTLLPVTLAPKEYIVLQWNEPSASLSPGHGSTNDLDLFLTDAAGNVVANLASTYNNIGGDPVEFLSVQGGYGQTYYLRIGLYSGAAPTDLKLTVLSNGAYASIVEPTSNTNDGTIYGHQAAAGTIAVGAAAYYQTPQQGVSPPVLETFSSTGPTTISFDTAGNRLSTPVTRNGPAFTAVDGGNTNFFGTDDSHDSDTYPNFYGTSAASPDAAATAALMLQLNPNLTPAQIKQALMASAIDMDNPYTTGFDTGYDNATGSGLIQADAALALVAPISPTITIGTVAGDNIINAAEAGSNVSISGTTANIEFGRTVTVTLVDSANQVQDTLTVPDGSGTYTVQLTTTQIQALSDGTYALKADASNQSGTAANEATRTLVIDRTADAGNDLVVQTNPVVNAAGRSAVHYTLAGLDSDATATVTFSDGAGHSTVGSGGTADLSSFADGTVTVAVAATDTAGNTATGAGTTLRLDTTADVAPVATLTVNDTADHVVNAAESHAVAYSVAGLDGDAAATATFTDGSHTATATVAANGSFTVDLSGLNGTVSTSLAITDTAGNTASITGPSLTLDTTADVVPTATLSVNDTADHVVNAAESHAVAFTVAGLDGDAGGTATFTDGTHTATVSVAANGSFTIDLSALNGTVSTSLAITDTAGNTASITGPSLTLDTTADAVPVATLSVNDTADHVVNAAESHAVAYTVAGLDTDASAVATFTDGTHTASASVAANGSFTVDLSALNGTVSTSLAITDTAGNTASIIGPSLTLDTSADAVPVATLSVNDTTDHVVNAAESHAVAYTVAGLDTDATALVTFRDGTHTASASVAANGSFTIDLSAFSGMVSSALAITDAAGNVAAIAGTSILLDTSADTAPVAALSVNDTADHVVNAAESHAVAYTVAGLDTDATALATFTDGTHTASASVAANGSFTIDLSSFSGTVSSALAITDTAGNTATVAGTSIRLDTTADAAPLATLRIDDTADHVINAAESRSVGFAVAGLDTDASAVATFTDGSHSASAGVAANGSFTIDLSALSGTVSSTLAIADAAGNAAAAAGNAVTIARSITAVADTFAAAAHGTATGNILANDLPATAGDTLAVTSIKFGGGLTVAVPSGGTASIIATHGTLTVGSDGHYSYLAMHPGSESFTYTAADGHGSSGTATLTATALPNTTPPPADASFNFAFLSATVTYSDGEALLTGPDGVVRDVTGIGHLHFTDGTIDENDGSPLVDDLFYFARNHDVYAAGVDADLHYVTSGWHEGRDPNQFFSTSGYLDSNPDVARAGFNPLVHYDLFGWKEGRDPGPLFNTKEYLDLYPDVAAARIDPLAHELANGVTEGRVTLPGGFVNGASGDFDARFYLAHNADVASAGIDPLAHFLTFGVHEGRDPNAYFSTSAYLAANPDVAAAGIDPLLHYEIYGWKEGRSASGFNTNGYLAANPDVAAAHIDPMQHFLQYGLAEGRHGWEV